MSVEGEGDWSQPEFASEYRFSCFFSRIPGSLFSSQPCYVIVYCCL